MYITLDNETGGLGLQTSLLTSYFGVLDDEFNLVDELYLRIKHDDYVVQAGGMAVNKINLFLHDSIAEYKTTAGKKLYSLLHYNCHVRNNSTRLVAVGHGIHGDLAHIHQDLLNKQTWEQFVSYCNLDTSSVAQYFVARGILPPIVSGSLESLAEHYGIKQEGEFHDARTDALATAQVLQKMLKEKL